MRAQLRDRGESGFTLIELLVVIVIIAILASIAIPIYLNQREKAYMSQIQSALKNAAIAVESYAVGEPNGYLPLDGLTGAALDAEGYQVPDWAMAPGYIQIEANRTTFCIQAQHAQLSSSSAWRRAIFDVTNGEPTSTPDTCPSL